MGKREQSERESYTYNDSGTMEVAQQILDSYNSGVVDSRVVEERNQE